jgi:hypothetical protein
VSGKADGPLLGTRIDVTTVDGAYEVVERFYRRERVSAKTGFYL